MSVLRLLEDLVSEKTVRALGAALGEPVWLTEERVRHWRAAAGAGHPAARDEDWRRTPEEFFDLAPVLAPLVRAARAGRARPTVAPAAEAAGASSGRASAGEAPATATPPAEASATASLLGWDGRGAAGVLVQEGATVRSWLRPDAAAAGVFLGDLAACAHEQPSLLSSYPLAESFPPGESFLFGLILSLGAGGFVLHVPAGVRLEDPVLVEARPAPGDPAPLLRPCLVVADAGARVRVVEVLAGGAAAPEPEAPPAPAGAPLLGSLLAIHAGEGAEVEHVSVQGGDPGARCFASRRARLLEGASLRWHLAEAGGATARSEAHAWLAADGAAVETACVLVGGGTQHLDLAAGAIHLGSRTRSRLLVHAAAAGQARTIFRGNGHIQRGARGADLDQRHSTLLLGPQARAYSRPALVIDENDVRASHGAAASPPGPEEVFYLMSRGLPKAAATRLLVSGFLRAVAAGLPAPLDGEALLAALAAKLTGEEASR